MNAGIDFAQLCDDFNSDKGTLKQEAVSYPWHAHTYQNIYSLLFDHCREEVNAVFECGIGPIDTEFQKHGIRKMEKTSLGIWSEYFPNASIVGADIDLKALFNGPRIESYFVNQLDSLSVARLWQKCKVEKFDLMIDDGLHTFPANVSLFEGSIKKLNRSGIYVIEDVSERDFKLFIDYFSVSNFSVQFVAGSRKFNKNDNLILIKHTASTAQHYLGVE